MVQSNEIEYWLSRTRVEPPADLRERVLGATRAELARRPAVLRWRWIAAAAAASLLWLHVSWSAALNTRLETGADDRPEVGRLTQQIEGLAPELSPAEARRLALVLHAGAQTPWAGVPARGSATLP